MRLPDHYLDNELFLNPAEFDRWIGLALSGEITDHDVADLAFRLAASGQCLQPSKRAVDLASTGGPGSLSTLLTPLALVASGLCVPKLGVPGRPAGGIDVLSQIPGYAVRLERPAAEAILSSCGYVHLLAGDVFAPADAAMFAYRQRKRAQALPSLVIASLLSKKLAMGVDVVGLEVRVSPHGNFGGDLEAARRNAERFGSVATICGLDATCFLTDGTLPQQPFLGRGEALMAMFQLLSSQGNSWLNDHASDCLSWSSLLSGSPPATWTQINDAFKSNVIAQGGSVDGFEEMAAAVASAHSRTIDANSDGYIHYDLGMLREAILAVRGADEVGAFHDTAGLILLIEPGLAVRRGDPLISVRCNDVAWATFHTTIAAAIEMSETPEPQRGRGTLEVVRV